MRMSRNLDRLTLLTTFLRIAERGSITAAASDLGMAQASASRQLALLEARLDATLIRRTTHSLTLTEAGRRLLPEAQGLLQSWEALEERFSLEQGAIAGPLKVVAPVGLGQTILGDAALAFQAQHPDVTLTWILDDSQIRFAEIGCDLWIKAGRPGDESLIVRDLAEVERLVVAAPEFGKARKVDHPRGLDELACAALSDFEGSSIPLVDRGGERFLLKAHAGFTSDNLFVIKQAACKGIGFAVMPRWLVAEELAAGVLLDLLPDWRAPSLSITAAYAPARQQTLRLRVFLEAMQAAVAATSTPAAT